VGQRTTAWAADADSEDMITSHASYWSDRSFATFLLVETFSTRLGLMRTGLGLAERVIHDVFTEPVAGLSDHRI
jgi:hypothetical protein